MDWPNIWYADTQTMNPEDISDPLILFFTAPKFKLFNTL